MHSSLKLAPIIPVSAYLDQPMGQHSHSLHCTTTGHDCCNCADELTMNMVTLCALYFTAIYFNSKFAVHTYSSKCMKFTRNDVHVII